MRALAALVLGLGLAAAGIVRAEPSRPFVHSISVDYGINHPRLPQRQEKLLRRLAELKQAGLRQVRLELSMKDTETIAGEAGHPAVELVRKIRALDLEVLAVVGVGGRRALRPGLSVDQPGYVAEVSRNVRDIASRFAREGLRVDYQVENELNVAGLASGTIMRWRSGRRWWDPRFKLHLLEELARAVRESDPAARVTTNFFDGLSDPTPAELGRSSSEVTTLATALLFTDKNLRHAIRQLSAPVDEVGIDYYPNYVLPLAVTRRIGGLFDQRLPYLRALGTADPAAAIARRVALYREVTGKPVRVAEIGYETRSPLGHSAAGQARFIAEVLPAVRRSGAIGVNWFRLFDYPAHADDDGGALRFLDPNRIIEPHFGIYDAELEPKQGVARRWSSRQVLRLRVPWLEQRTVSPVDAYKDELQAGR